MSQSFESTAPKGLPYTEADRLERHEALAGLLAAYADGELPPETAAQIEAHLLGCERCRRELSLQRAVATSLGQIRGPEVSAAFQTRLKQAVAAAAVPPLVASVPEPTPWWQRPVARLAVGGAALALAAWYAGYSTRTAPANEALRLQAPRAVVVSTNALFDSLRNHYEQTAARDLPGRARDLDMVRRAVGMPIVPLSADLAQLSGAWTATIDGELIGVLAYRWQNQLLIQYVIPDAVVFRSASVRNALAQQQVVAGQWGALGLLGWPQARGMTVMMAPTPWAALRLLQPAGG